MKAKFHKTIATEAHNHSLAEIMRQSRYNVSLTIRGAAIRGVNTAHHNEFKLVALAYFKAAKCCNCKR
jgi:DNA-binding GntR family transcriptional regulator